MSWDVGEVTESLENQNELWRRWSDWKLGEWAELIDIDIYSRTHSPIFQSLHLRPSSFWFSKLSVTSPTSQLILQPIPSLYLRHNSFSNPSVASPTSQFILQHFFRFSNVTGFSLTSPGETPMLIHEQSSFSKLSVTSPMSQFILILLAFRHFTYVTAHFPTLPSLYLRHNTFSNPSAASPTSQVNSNPSFASPTSQDFHLRHLASRPCSHRCQCLTISYEFSAVCVCVCVCVFQCQPIALLRASGSAQGG